MHDVNFVHGRFKYGLTVRVRTTSNSSHYIAYQNRAVSLLQVIVSVLPSTCITTAAAKLVSELTFQQHHGSHRSN